MKKGLMVLLLTIGLSMMMAACSDSKEAVIESKLSAKEMAEEMVKQVEQPAQIELEPDGMETFYHLDPNKLEEYAVRLPMMNIKTNEIAILKVKEAKDLPEVEAAVKQRAEDVQKQFETYLPDQYENAKNYKLVTKGNYVLMVISEKADELVKVFDSFFNEK